MSQYMKLWKTFMFINYVSIYKIMENIYVSQIIDDIRIYRL